MTSAPGRSIVLMRPPSLDPSTPDVREPREWVTAQNFTWCGLQPGQDGVGSRFVAQPARVQDQVVVARQVPGVPVDLTDVGPAVLVRLLHPAARLLHCDALPLDDGLDPFGL